MSIQNQLNITGFVLLFLAFGAGCSTTKMHHHSSKTVTPVRHAPRELRKLPGDIYRIEPPDVLTISVLNALPNTPYQLRTLDSVQIEVEGALPDHPIQGVFPVGLEGDIFLGAPYGNLAVAGLTIDEVEKRLRKFLTEEISSPLIDPNISVWANQIAATQQVNGEVMVGPDGMITLGSYGSVAVTGLTLDEARFAIEAHLSQYLQDPVVALDVYAYNSRTYYLILEGAGLGDRVYRFPFTGNETVLDAMSLVNGMTELQSKRIWVARPSCNDCQSKVMPVDWCAITKCGSTATNYQIFPGDRIFVAEDGYVAMDTKLGKFLAPLERVMGFSILGAETATRLSGKVLQGGGNPRGSNF